MRMGVFGGSFDPIHHGHLILADLAREQLGLDRVLMVPAAQSPLKPAGSRAPAQARWDMLRLALADAPGLEACDVELNRPGPSYTLDTLQAIRTQYPEASLFLIVGSDQLALLDHWRGARAISEIATWSFVKRAGGPELDWNILARHADDSARHAAERSVIQMPAMEVSSSEIRQRVANKQSIRFRTPRAVEAYIAAHGLYQL